MLEIMKPFYYDLFSCTAGKCKGSCCSLGWEIKIDADTYQKYQNIGGRLGEKLQNYTSKDSPHYILQENGGCPFYSTEGLCELHAVGKTELQSETCRNYPRFATSYNDFFDLSLTLSCPEVADTILHCTEPITYIEECYDDRQDTRIIAEEILETFRIMRKRCTAILQTRTEPLWHRVYDVSAISLSLHQWNKKEYREFFKTVNPLLTSQPITAVGESKNYLKQMLSILECMESVSVLSSLFDPAFQEMRTILTDPDYCAHYDGIHLEFNDFYKDYLYIYENYMVYYLNQNFLIGLVEENQSLDKEIAWMSISCALLKLCAETIWYKDKHALTMEKQVDIMYTFARVFEHGIIIKEVIYNCMCKLGLCEPKELAALLQSIL